MRLLKWIAFLAAGLFGLAAHAQELTLDGVLSAPIPTHLTTARGDGRVAWVSNDRGVRNIWVATPRKGGGYDTRAVTARTEDDGYEVDALGWAADGSTIVYTGGGSLEGGGPVNPTSRASGPYAKEILVLRVGDAASRSLGLGESPAPAPSGDRLAFIRAGQIWTAGLGPDEAATQLVVDRGSAGSLTWSPDGSKLAFVSHRPGGQSLLGIYDFGSARLTWMAPSADRDTAPTWSPDGRRIAWARLPSGGDQAVYGFRPIRTGPPWSIWTGDPTTGRGTRVWRADVGAGSVVKLVEDGSLLFWTADGRLVFPWEKTGWLRLYSMPGTGGATVPLTPDGSEVFAVAMDAARTGFVFSSNSADDDHRHLWRVAAAGGTPQRLTSGATIEDLPVVTRGGDIIALHGSGRDPLTPSVLAAQGRMVPLVARDPGFPRKLLVEPQRVLFTSPDGLEVHGQLFEPTDAAARKRPAILFFHGGPPRQMLLGWHPMGAYAHIYAMNQYLASKGFVVLSVNFRGGTGYGLNFRNPPGFAEAGASEVQDIAGALAYLRSRADVDASRIGVYGMSYGGVMTSLALARFPDAFRGGVDVAGVHNWKSFLPYLTAPGAAPGPAEIAYRSSAIANAADWRAPVLLVHGDDDRAVNFSQTVELVAALRAVGKVEPEQLVIPDEVHDFIRHATWRTILEHGAEFLERTVKGGKDETSPPTAKR